MPIIYWRRRLGVCATMCSKWESEWQIHLPTKREGDTGREYWGDHLWDSKVYRRYNAL